MNIIEKILAKHADKESVKPGDIVNVFIDCRVARDFGGANVIEHLLNNNLTVNDPDRTLFTFDCNPGGSDQKYAANQHMCRRFARENGIKVLDIHCGIGTHQAIDTGLAYPGSTFLSTDSHANIMGAIGSFGQGMGDRDIAAAWANGKVWFKVPESVKLNFTGKLAPHVSAKDFVINLLTIYGANTLLAKSVELYGDCIDNFTLDQRITIASMATEMGAIILMFPPSKGVLEELKEKTGKMFTPVYADADAVYADEQTIDVTHFETLLSLPGHPHHTIAVKDINLTTIDSAFIGSCTNGRMEDLRIAAEILKGKKVADQVVLKIVPSTDTIWKQALDEGLIRIFKDAGALVSNAGCAGCAAGQIGQNGPEEVTVSTGSRNFAGKQGKGLVYLASPAVVAASAVAGYITAPHIKVSNPPQMSCSKPSVETASHNQKTQTDKPTKVQGRIWIIDQDDIDTDMIFHNRYLTITKLEEMGQYAFDNLKGYENFAKEAQKGDIVMTGKNFGAGSSRQQAVDCFIALGISCILAQSYGAIYERNAINAAMPILIYSSDEIAPLKLSNKDIVSIDLMTGEIKNLTKNTASFIHPFFDVQNEIYQKGGLLG
jgi:3-isopropylmalate dehydratase small subunit